MYGKKKLHSLGRYVGLPLLLLALFFLLDHLHLLPVLPLASAELETAASGAGSKAGTWLVLLTLAWGLVNLLLRRPEKEG